MKLGGRTVSASVRVLWILLLALLAGPAFALGLGQIKVKSQHGQPLLAEIPILSSDPSELVNLQARLASPETFARIGLAPPRGLVSDLQFSVALDPRGQPIVRITSQAPVQQSLLSFLVEVDWGHGRLVREYSALVDTPQSVAAASQPQIQAPQLAAPNTIVREPARPAAPVVPPVPVPEETPDDRTLAAPAAAAPPAPPVAIPAPRAPAPAPVAPPRATPVAAAAVTPPAQREVRSGQALSQIARELARDEDRSLNQTMLALLRANPDAFIGGNINRVRQGAVLRVPSAADYVHSVGEADALVRQQVSQWRESRRPVSQPDAVLAADAATSTPAASTPAPSKPAASTPAAATAAARTGDARLAIVPTAAVNERRAGTRSGLNAGGEGDMLRQQELVQTKETLAAREAELTELKARVSELEQLQQQQAQLISMKDNALAAAQQRLADSNQRNSDVAQPVAAEPATAAEPAASGPGIAWIGLGAGLVLLALLLLWRRRRAAPQTRKPVFDTAALAAAMPVDDVRDADDAPVSDGVATPAAAIESPEPPALDTPSFATAPAPTRAPDPVADPVADPVPVPEPAPAPAPDPMPTMPTWHAGQGSGHVAIVVAPVADTPPASASPGYPDDAPPAFADARTQPASAPLPASTSAAGDSFATEEPAGKERIELARAYLDLGDVDTARSLLREVADTGDELSRSEAARLLRDLA